MSNTLISLSDEERKILIALVDNYKNQTWPGNVGDLVEKLSDTGVPLFGFLELSTQHVSQSTLDWIDDRAQETADGKAAHFVSRTPHGFYLFCDEENGSGDIPADLFECMQKARDLGAEYILFDDEKAPNFSLDLPVFLPVFNLEEA